MFKRSVSIKKLDELEGKYICTYLKLCDDGKWHKIFKSSNNKLDLERRNYRPQFSIFTREQYKEMYSKKTIKQTKKRTTKENKDNKKEKTHNIITGRGFKLTEYFYVADVKKAINYSSLSNSNYEYTIDDLKDVYSYCIANKKKVKKEIELIQLMSKKKKIII